MMINPTMPTNKEQIKIPNDEKNRNFPTFFGFLIKKGIIITKKDQTLEIIPIAVIPETNPVKSLLV